MTDTIQPRDTFVSFLGAVIQITLGGRDRPENAIWGRNQITTKSFQGPKRDSLVFLSPTTPSSEILNRLQRSLWNIRAKAGVVSGIWFWNGEMMCLSTYCRYSVRR